MAETKRSLFVKKKYTVAVGQTLVVDQIDLEKFNCLEYVLELQLDDKTKMKCLKMLVGKGDEDFEEQVYAIRGQDINIEYATQENGSNYELVYTNNEAQDVRVAFTRLIF